jgi:hypothetical protein
VSRLNAGCYSEDVAISQVELGVLTVTQPLRRLDNLVHDGLKSLAARNGTEHLTDCLPLLARSR